MSDTEVSLSKDECQRYVKEAIAMKAAREFGPIAGDDLDKRVLLAAERYKQVEQYLRGLGC